MNKLLVPLLLLASGSALALEPSYPMICRGPIPYLQDGTWIELQIKRGTGPAGPHGENLAPGFCAFLDRGIQDSEPNSIEFRPSVASGPPSDPLAHSDNALFAADHTASLISLVSTLRSTGYFKVRVRRVGDSAGRKYFQGSLSLAEFWY